MPDEPVRRERFDDVCGRTLGECNTDALWALATVARKATVHGTMLVISADAAGEAARLRGQALAIKKPPSWTI